MCDKLSDFQEGQWWVKELDELVKNGALLQLCKDNNIDVSSFIGSDITF